mmetsp:Transcript_25294/g.58991  ORF Transcript_25294/g.58991 Transcript_25294/m.58991 type:complete len:263 (-) Transcript_25294:582-1370(-)
MLAETSRSIAGKGRTNFARAFEMNFKGREFPVGNANADPVHKNSQPQEKQPLKCEVTCEPKKRRALEGVQSVEAALEVVCEPIDSNGPDPGPGDADACWYNLPSDWLDKVNPDYAKKMDSGKDNADDGDSCTSDAQCGVVGNYCAKDTCHDGSAGDQCDQDSDCERMGNYCQRDKDNIFADGACQRGLEGDRCQDGDHCVSCGECKKLTGIDLEGKKACTLKGHKPPGQSCPWYWPTCWFNLMKELPVLSAMPDVMYDIVAA